MKTNFIFVVVVCTTVSEVEKQRLTIITVPLRKGFHQILQYFQFTVTKYEICFTRSVANTQLESSETIHNAQVP